ncbi:unnamed protein product [Gongylonema pulchrum]|uniref:RNase_PH domain-containing protein n=1 Tax=Gongylonema pulchrum TaxID=637853 RepID=A0A183DWU9_9BILA|nr:unnamed protein product [Gongylonema pulchrum]
MSSRIQKLRDLRAQLSFLSRADGSCALEQGATVVWCGINGPGDAPISKRLTERLFIDATRLVNAALEHSVDRVQYSRAVLTVTVHQLQDDGSTVRIRLNTQKGEKLFDRKLSCVFSKN